MNFNFPHLYLEETDSTNAVAFELLSKINPSHGFTVISDYQTAGKGQYGREWQSEPAKNLLFSVILGPDQMPIDDMFFLHLVSSLAIIRTLDEMGIPKTEIKWPNDIYIGTRKLAGILIQNQLQGKLIQWSVVGIGLNVNQTQFPDFLNASSLKLEMEIYFDRMKILERIRNYLLEYYNQLLPIPWKPLLDKYNQALYLKNHWIVITTKDNETLMAKIDRVDQKGLLHVTTSDSQKLQFAFGEIQYEKIERI
jgi:BirA family transcriptional regulator, biotin operon repressor / biotin---[acetyl-CoA-carboxylase] ligase